MDKAMSHRLKDAVQHLRTGNSAVEDGGYEGIVVIQVSRSISLQARHDDAENSTGLQYSVALTENLTELLQVKMLEDVFAEDEPAGTISKREASLDVTANGGVRRAVVYPGPSGVEKRTAANVELNACLLPRIAKLKPSPWEKQVGQPSEEQDADFYSDLRDDTFGEKTTKDSFQSSGWIHAADCTKAAEVTSLCGGCPILVAPVFGATG
jgi:hypothetical protein